MLSEGRLATELWPLTAFFQGTNIHAQTALLDLLRRCRHLPLAHQTAGEVAMPVMQRQAVATIDSATDKATVLVGEGRGVAMCAGSARKCSVTVVKVSRVLLGVRGGSSRHHGRKQGQFQHMRHRPPPSLG